MRLVELTIDRPYRALTGSYGEPVAWVYGHEEITATVALDPGEALPSVGAITQIPTVGPVLITNFAYSQWPYIELRGRRADDSVQQLFPSSPAKVDPPKPVAMPKNPTPIFGKDTRRIVA